MKNSTQEQKKNGQKKEEEKHRMLLASDKIKGEQLSISDSGEFVTKKEIELFAIGNKSVDNPEKKYDIYYRGIEKLLRKHLPKGKQSLKARSYIREEKCTFLTRGKRINEKGIRNADSRMGYIVDAEQVLNIITDWILKNGTMVELHNNLRELNIKMGYGKRIIY